MDCSDKKICQLLETGLEEDEDQALKCIFDKYRGEFMLYCKNRYNGLLINNSEVESIFNTSVLQFIEHIRGKAKFTYKRERGIFNYLLRLSRNHKPKPSSFPKTLSLDEIREIPLTPNTEDREMIEIMNKAVKLLSATDQEIIIAFYYNQVKLADYAKTKGIKPSTARKRKQYAIERLTDFFQKMLKELSGY